MLLLWAQRCQYCGPHLTNIVGHVTVLKTTLFQYCEPHPTTNTEDHTLPILWATPGQYHGPHHANTLCHTGLLATVKSVRPKGGPDNVAAVTAEAPTLSAGAIIWPGLVGLPSPLTAPPGSPYSLTLPVINPPALTHTLIYPRFISHTDRR